MGKRSNFERRPRDFYPTPERAVEPLLPHLSSGTRFCEPCAGDGALIRHLEKAGHNCAAAWDIEPQAAGIDCQDATQRLIGNIDCFITNPPWDRSVLHPIIEHLCAQYPTWLLFDADWMHTKQSARFIPWLRKVVSVGRVKWIEDSPFTGKDNCCWYLFNSSAEAPVEFIGRSAA